MHRFSADGSYELTDKFNSVRQNSDTVKEYTKRFEDLIADVQEDDPNISESWFVRCYVNGPRDRIKFQVRPLRPATLTDAYWLASDIEPGHPRKRQYSAGTPFQKFAHYQAPKPVTTPSPAAVPKVQEQANLQPRIRKYWECWRCGDKWVHKHKCKLIPNIHLMQEEITTEEQPGQEAQEHSDIEMGQQLEQEQCMHISAQAIGGLPLVTLPTVKIYIGGQVTMALLDSGSNSTYIDHKFALKANCPLMPAPI